MDKNSVIHVEKLTKVYKLYNRNIERLKESIHPFRKQYHHDFYALDDISFTICKGETVAILGKNGSGKSTLLKILTGVLTPTAGTVFVNGKVAALLELGAGFNPEMTGLENIYLSGLIMGYKKEEMNVKVDDIMSFADIGDFMHQPVKMYSSGMFARLAFAVNANVNPDVLIVDEALAVGDMFFQAKCIDKMKQMMDDGVTILFVSHDTSAVKSLCGRGILLNSGKIVNDSSADEIVEAYFALKVQSEQQVIMPPSKTQSDTERSKNVIGDNSAFKKKAQYQRIQNGKAEFNNIQILNTNGEEVALAEYGQTLILRMIIVVHEDIENLGYGYHIRSSTGVDIVYSDSKLEEKMLQKLKKGDRYIVDWEFEGCLMQGTYNISCVLSIPIDLSISKVEFCDFIPCAVQFSINNKIDKQLYGYVHWENKISIEKI